MAIEARTKLGRVEQALCLAHASALLEDDGQGNYYAPLWLGILAQAFAGACGPSELTFPGLVALVEASDERRNVVALSGRLGVVSASDVLAMCQQWSEE